MEKKMIIVGAIGNTARQNRDRFRVFARGGTSALSVLGTTKVRSW